LRQVVDLTPQLVAALGRDRRRALEAKALNSLLTWRRIIGVLVTFASLCPFVFASNSEAWLWHYAHRSWTNQNSALKSSVRTIAQTTDGYLWLGTDSGLIRFDGVRMVPWTPPPGQELPGGVWRMVGARDGTLWFATTGGLASWKNGRLTQYPVLSGFFVSVLLEDRDGTVWASGGWGDARGKGKLCALRNGIATCYDDNEGLGNGVSSLYEDASGGLWAGTATGLWHWKPGPPIRYAADVIPWSMTEGENSSGITFSADGMVRQIAAGKITNYPLPGAPSPLTARFLHRDHHGALWIGTSRGLLYSYQSTTRLITRSDGLSSDEVGEIFEDHEGTIWICTSEGLDSFRELPFSSLSKREGLSSDSFRDVLAASDGSIWIGTHTGLDRREDGHIRVYGARTDPGLPGDDIGTLFEDERARIWVQAYPRVEIFEAGRFRAVPSVPPGTITSMASDHQGGLWLQLLGNPNDYGLVHLVDGKVIEKVPWKALGGGPGAGLVVEPDGGVWTGLFIGGIAYFRGGQIRHLQLSGQDTGSRRVFNLSRAPDGALWVAGEQGLSRIANGRVSTLTTANGLPCNVVHWIMEDDVSSYWLLTSCGLLRVARSDLDAWITDPNRKIQPTIFDSADGIPLRDMLLPWRPHVTKSLDGRIWFVNVSKVSVIDPSHIAVNTLPPPVHIEQITADGKPVQETGRGLHLPALIRSVAIEYTALSLVAPERVRFRYKLEGQDPDWSEITSDRKVQYSNLAPRNYRFRVIASNNSGLWNETGDTLEFSVDPAYYQTGWFRALCVAVFLVLLWVLYQLRFQQLKSQERKLREVVETIPQLVAVFGPDRKRLYANRPSLDYLGLTLEEWQAISDPLWFFHPDDRERLAKDVYTDRASYVAHEFEARFRGKDGTYRWFLFRDNPLHDEQGRGQRWYLSATDIEDRKRAEDRLRSTSGELQRVMASISDCLWSAEIDENWKWTYRYYSPTVEKITGRPPTFFVHDPSTWIGMVHPDDRGQILKDFQLLASGQSEHVEGEYRILRPDGEIRWVRDSAVATRSGRLLRIDGVVSDITYRKRAEEEREKLHELEATLAHINRLSVMGEMTASIAHEINQPLSGIVSNGSACLRWLAGDAPNLAEVREAVSDIVRDGKRAGEVIARVRALTRRTAPPKEKLDLNETIREILAIVGDEAKRNRVTVRTRFAQDLFPVFGDRVQLQQVVLNLVMNAIEAMSNVAEHARELVITTRNVDADHVQATVEDFGIGLDQKAINKVFDSFYTTKADGMGMGLSISRSILQAHGGRLWATAKDGPGTMFHFTIPKCHERGGNARV
jgi:PAS domain S-box-containing protein